MKTLASIQTYREPLLVMWLLVLCLTAPPASAQSVPLHVANILIYSATKEFRHDSIPTAIEALKSRSASYNITFDNTEDFTWFREGRLQKYNAIVFLSTTGESASFHRRPVLSIVDANALCSP